MNPLIYVILIVMILFTIYHFWTDIRNAWNTGETFAEGMTNNVCTTEDECKQVATSLGLKLGDGTLPFANTTYDVKGLYAFKTGGRAGEAYFGAGGTPEQMKAAVSLPKYRPIPLVGAAVADPKNNVQWKCIGKHGGAAGTYNIWDANTLTTLQKSQVIPIWGDDAKSKEDGGSGPAYYACKQGCEDLDNGTCEKTELESSLAKFAQAPAAAGSMVLDQPLNNAYGAGAQINTDNSPTQNTVVTTDNQGNTITTKTTESSSVDPTTGEKIQEKCINISQLASAGAWVDHLFGALSNTKCADKNKIDAAKSASKLDFISGAIAPSNSNEHYMKAINKAKPFLEQAFANNQNSLAQGSTNTISGNNNNLAQGTTEGISNNTAQTQAPVTNNIQAPKQPNWQAQQMAQQFQQGQQQQTINGQVLPNGFIVQPGNGKCPNGCKYPQYDNKGCEDTILNGKSYRKCPWVKDGLTGNDCTECGAILMPKNKFGYARTRPGLFDNVSVNMAIENAESSKKGDYYNIGKKFMKQLSQIKNFNLPDTVDTNEYVSIGKMVHKYQTEETSSSKNLLTDFINQLLTTSNMSNNGKVQNNSLISEQVNKMGGNFDIDQKKLTMKGAYAYAEGKKEVADDNRLGGSSSMYEKQISEKIRKLNGIPRDPRKRPNPYDSIWDIFQ
jgi:hypothetical protein